MFAYKIDTVWVGAISVAWWSCRTAQHANVPPAWLLLSSGSDHIVATPIQSVVFRTDTGSLVPRIWLQQGRIHGIKIDRKAVEKQLETLLGQPPSSGITFEPKLDLTRGRGLQWWTSVEAFAAQLNDVDSLSRHPLMTAPVVDSIISGLLLAAGHDYRAELDRPTMPARQLAVRRAVEYIESHAEMPLTVGEIAAAAGVGIRALQQGFQTALGIEPMRYLREVRLARARQDLLTMDIDEAGVAEVAYRWGFAHLGRFARRYRELYGETPSDTLRGE